MSLRMFNLVITVIGLVLSTQNAMAFGVNESDLKGGQSPSRQGVAIPGGFADQDLHENNPTSGGPIGYFGASSQIETSIQLLDRYYDAVEWGDAFPSGPAPYSVQPSWYVDSSLEGWQDAMGSASRIWISTGTSSSAFVDGWVVYELSGGWGTTPRSFYGQLLVDWLPNGEGAGGATVTSFTGPLIAQQLVDSWIAYDVLNGTGTGGYPGGIYAWNVVLWDQGEIDAAQTIGTAPTTFIPAQQFTVK